MTIVAALRIGRPEPTPEPDDVVAVTCPRVLETPGMRCGFSEGTRISIDDISVKIRDGAPPVCGMLQGYADAVVECATREAGHVSMEVRVVSGNIQTSATSADPAVARCMENRAARLGFGSDDDVQIAFSVTIRRPHLLAEDFAE